MLCLSPSGLSETYLSLFIRTFGLMAEPAKYLSEQSGIELERAVEILDPESFVASEMKLAELVKVLEVIHGLIVINWPEDAKRKFRKYFKNLFVLDPITE